jgi:hypothetical protein
MPATMRDKKACDPRTPGNEHPHRTLTEAVGDVREAIRLVKANVERFVSRAVEIPL